VIALHPSSIIHPASVHPSVRHPSIRRLFTFSNDISSVTTGLFPSKFIRSISTRGERKLVFFLARVIPLVAMATRYQILKNLSDWFTLVARLNYIVARLNCITVLFSLLRLVHSGRQTNTTSGTEILTFGTRSGTRNGIETHIFRVETQRDLAHWSRALVQGSHGAAALVKEVTCRKGFFL